MFIVIKSEHYDCTNLICKKDTLEEAVAAVKDSMAQRINKNYHAGLTGTDITHENEDHYGFSFTFDENRNADSSEPRAYSKCLALAKSIDTLQLCYGPYFNSLKVESLWSKAFELMDDVTRSEIVEDLKLFQRAWRKYKEEKPVKDAQKILDAISELFGEEVTSK